MLNSSINQNTIVVRFSRLHKYMLSIIGDLFLVELSLLLSLMLVMGEQLSFTQYHLYIALLAAFSSIIVFNSFGLYKIIIRFIGFNIIWKAVQAVSIYSMILSLIVLGWVDSGIPRTFLALNFINTLFFIVGSRLVARWYLTNYKGYGYNTKSDIVRNVVIYGAGSAGMQLSMALKYGRGLKVVAFIDDDETIQNHQINGIKIHPFCELSYLVRFYEVEEVLLALPSISQDRRNNIISMLEPYPVHVRTVPDLSEIAHGKVKVEDLREVDILDLLGRDQISSDIDLLHANITNKTVMITGAGGSIGSELCRQVLKYQPKQIILFEANEFALYQIEKEINGFIELQENDDFLVPVLGSIENRERVEKVCRAFDVRTIYHAAAYKHVPMVEKNPGEAIRNNIFGTLSVAQAAVNTKVETFVLISTDKAVRPTNTMGATKRFAELILQAYSQSPTLSKNTRFTMVRFGNVVGSSGSVIPLFREQIAKGGPVTVTDKRVIRYFMTISEAVELVIQAGAMGQGGDVFVLDMGEPVRIYDLAKRMIHLSGYSIRNEKTPDGDIEIIFTGLRPGEKLFEELLIGDNVYPTKHEKIMRAKEKVIEWPQLQVLIKQLDEATKLDDYERARAILKEGVTGFIPQCEIVDLVSRVNQVS